ncbi:uncharacterized protein LOC144655885 isoform X2 [Oculina patagonica]
MASFQPPSHLFERNISLNDLDSALDVREIVRRDVVVPEDVTKHRYLESSTKYSFVLPSFQDFPMEFRKFVYSFLVDGHILRELEAARRLNWCTSLGRMVTVNTLGDGNCLMHAASIGMWAVNDRYQILRKTVYEALVEDVEGFYHSRWKCEEERQISNQIGGYKRTEEQWNHEWEEVIRHISQTEFPFGRNGAQFGSLEEIHIFVLANILRRTIIVLSDETLRGPYGDSYSPINFGGIYLPLLWDSVDCVKSPLVIGYANGHFTAVVNIEDGKLDLGNENNPSGSNNCIHAVPLVKYDGMPLPVHFLYDQEVPFASDRLRQYLDCAKVPFSSNPGEARQTVLVAKLHFSEQPRCMKELIEGYFTKAMEEHERVLRHSQLHPQLQPGTRQPALQIVPCQTPGCSFYGCTETGNRCSQCLNEFLRTLGTACEPGQNVSSGQIQQQVAVTTQQAPNASAWQQTATTTTQAPANTSVASSMTLPVASSAKCRTAGCKYGAMPDRGGLCERCFEAERSAEEMAASMNHMSLASAKHCSNRVNGCEFFGLPEHHNLCSRCYRTFCLRMENTLGVQSPTGLPPRSPAPLTPPNRCQNPDCPSPGVPALYGMCVQCYTGCIHNFITSEGRSVGSAAQTTPHLPSPPMDVRRKNMLPTGGRTKGVLCASPGCCNEGIFQLSDLCAECHARKSGPSPQMRNTPVSAAGAVSFPVAAPPPSSMPTSAASTHQLTSALTGAIGYYCSNPICKNPIRKDGRGLCQRCESAFLTHGNPAASLQQARTRPIGLTTTASSMPPRQNTPAYTSSATSQTYTVPGASIGLPHQVGAPQAPHAEANTGMCAMGCGQRAVQEGGLCQACYTAAFQLELNRQTVPQPSRQQGAMASGVTSNQVEQRNTVETSSGRNLQQTEATAAKKKLQLLPCTTTACLNFGTPGQNGLCDDCYRKKDIRQQGAPSIAGANKRQVSSISGSMHSAQTTSQNHHFSNSSAEPAYYGLPGPVQVSQTQSPSYEAGTANSGNDAFHDQKCRGTNCTLFGTPETNGYCSRCFLESTIPLSYPHSIPDFPPQVSPSPAAAPHTTEKCRVTGCANFAAPERHGHCQQCFTRFYPEVVHREIVVQRQMSELDESIPY